jgi:hypothetical protein
MKRFLAAVFASAVAGSFLCAAVHAQYDGSLIRTGTENSITYASGGIGVTERTILKGWFDKYNLWVSCALESGHYLSCVPVTITNSSGRVVFEKETTGPWLLVKLPAGRYSIAAAYESTQEKQNVTVDSGLADVRFRWK